MCMNINLTETIPRSYNIWEVQNVSLLTDGLTLGHVIISSRGLRISYRMVKCKARGIFLFPQDQLFVLPLEEVKSVGHLTPFNGLG